MNKVFLDDLPRKIFGKNERIDWKNSVGYKNIKFVYNNLEGEIDIIGYENKQLLHILYNNSIYKISTGNFSKCKLGGLLKIQTKDYKYNVNDIIITKNGKIKLLETIRIPSGKFTQKGYKYECLIDGNIDEISESNINKGGGCNVCYNRKVLVGYNDIATTDFWMVEYMVNKEDAYKYTYGSGENILFKCKFCNKEKLIKICEFHDRGMCCSNCGDGISYGNKFIRNFLNQLEEEYISEYSPDWAFVEHNNSKLNGNKIYDNYLIDYNEIWEVHGIQHYEESFKRIKNKKVRTLEEEQENDKIKFELAKNNGLKYIEIDARKSNIDWIKNSLLNISELQRYDLSLIDWNKCHEFACSSLVKVACDYWNSRIKNLLDIVKLMKLSSVSIRKYLKQGAKLGWCDYDPKEEMRKNGKLNGSKRAIPIVQLSLNGEYIAEFKSAYEVENILNLNSASISFCCRKAGSSVYDCMWMYKEVYESNKNYIKPYKKKYRSRKLIVQLTLENEFIKEWNGIDYTSQELNINKTEIINCCKNKPHCLTAGGFRWMYKHDYYNNSNNLKPLNKYESNTKSVVQLDLNNNFIKCWNSISEVGNNLNVPHNHISSCCKGKRKTVGGYIWMYKEDYYNNINNLKPLNKKVDTTAKSIIQLDMNYSYIKEWNSLYDANKNINISISNISLCCSGKRKSAGGFKWMYKEDYEAMLLEQKQTQ